jgi:hypothetical protein
VSIYAPSFSPSDIVLSFQDVNQFSIITELLGTPPDDVIETIASENVGCTSKLSAGYSNSHVDRSLQTLRFVQSLPKRERVPFSQKLRTTDADGKAPFWLWVAYTY